jgi:hypothetical protein
MKPYLIFFFVSLVSFNLSYSQIGKKENVNEVLELVGEIDLFGGNGSTINGQSRIHKVLKQGKFILSFQNQDFKVTDNVVSITFNGDDNDLNYLFEELRSCFKTPKEKFFITVGDETLEFSNTNSNIIQIVSQDGYFFTTSGGLYILFGKEWNKKDFKEYLKS